MTTACLLLVAAAAAHAEDIQAQPSPAAPTAQSAKAQDSICKARRDSATAGGASIEITNAQRKQWQPVGGDLNLTLVSFKSLDANAQVVVCYSWAGDHRDGIAKRPKNVELASDLKTLQIVTTVPQDLPAVPDRQARYDLFLVPLAEVRVLVLDPKDNTKMIVDVSTTIGVSYRIVAAILAIIFAAVTFVTLDMWARKRLTLPGLRASKLNPFLRVISTPNGYASLSQFQILLWTFILGASAVYVMALSGELIQITTGALVLLGISGAATIGAEATGGSSQSLATGTGGGAAGVGGAAAGGDAGVAVKPESAAPPPHDRPLWSDLIMNETTNLRQVDVTRVQMLYFTLITAVFVVMKVATNYEIPDIPQGFQILMGISNAVYMGSKVVTKPS